MESKKFLTADEVASEFGLDERELQKFVEAKDVQALADRGVWKYRRDELQALVDAGKIAEPTASLWLDDASSAEGQVLTVGDNAEDDLSYIELDEDALAEQATMITKSNPLEDQTPVDEVATADNWFVPSNADEMRSQPTDPDHSSSDVRVFSEDESLGDLGSGAAVLDDDALSDEESRSDSIFDIDSPVSLSDSDSDVRIAGSASNLLGGKASSRTSGPMDSDSDVMIAADVPGGMLEGSGIVLDFDIGAGATVSSSGSSLRLPQTHVDDAASDWDAIETAGSGVLSGSSLGQSVEAVEKEGGSSLRLGDDDSGISLFGPAESGIVLEGDSRLGVPPTDSSVLLANAGGLAGDSSPALVGDDDSGLTLESADSGLTLEVADSGVSLAAADSGLTLEAAGDSGISLTPSDRTLSDEDGLGATMMFVGNAGSQTQTLEITAQSDDDSSFDMNFTDAGKTAELQLGDEDDYEENSATVVKKGPGKASPGLTEAFQLDDAPEVEDLDIADDLNAVVNDDDDDDAPALDDDDEVFEASEETFSDEHAATGGDDLDDDEFASADAIVAAKQAGPREPSWGTGMSVGLIACSLVLVANSLVLWSGVSTMWNGADASGPAAAVIAQLAGLIP